MKLEDYNNYKVGALKRKFKTGKENQAPGTFISKMNESKSADITKQTMPSGRTEKVAVMGLV